VPGSLMAASPPRVQCSLGSRRRLALAVALLLLHTLCGGAAMGAAPSRLPLAPAYPWVSPAEADGVEATSFHPAGLAFLEGAEAGVAGQIPTDFERGGGHLTWLGAGHLGPVYGGLAYSFFPVRHEPQASVHRLDLALAARLSDYVSVGLGWNGLFSDVDARVDAYAAWSLSTTIRPARALSFAVSLDRLNTPKLPDEEILPTEIRLAVGVRPATERVSFLMGGRKELLDGGGWAVDLGAHVLPVDGFSLGTYARYRATPGEGDAVEWGVALGLTQGAFRLGAGFGGRVPSGGEAPAGRAQAASLLLTAGTARRAPLCEPDGRVLDVRLAGPLAERPASSLLSPERPTILQWLAVLDMASRDPSVAGVLVRVDAAPGWAQCWELRQAFLRLRRRGKRVMVHLAVADMRALYLASGADRTTLHPAGVVMAAGLSITWTYFRTLLDRLGVRAEIVRYEDYKSAPEAFTRRGPSAPAREQTRALLEAFDRAWMEAVSQGRRQTPQRLRATLREAPLTMKMALDVGLVDALVDEADLVADMRDFLGFRPRLVTRYRPPARAWARWGGSRVVAIVPVVGTIVDGPTTQGLPLPIPFVGGARTGDRSFVSALEAAAADPSVAGIVVRVASHGGAALASDRMYRAVVEAARRKPLVVSFGEVAASGGYYLAVGAPRVLSTPLSITGSIGIFTGKADLSALLQRLGVDTYTDKTSPSADATSWYRPWTPGERARARKRLGAYYDRFVNLVARGRHLRPAVARAAARGRVYDGEAALERGLVDAEGGLWDAVEEVRRRAGANREPIRVEYRPGRVGVLARLGAVFGGARATQAVAPEVGLGAGGWLGEAARAVELLRTLAGGQVMAAMPGRVEIR